MILTAVSTNFLNSNWILIRLLPMDSSPQDLLNGSKYIAIGPGLKDLASPEHIFSKFKGEIG